MRELSNSIKELSDTTNKPAIWKMLELELRQLSTSITELYKWFIYMECLIDWLY